MDPMAEAAQHPAPAQPISLDKLPLRGRGTIIALREESAYLYLLRLGLVVGAEVELVRSVSRGTIKIFRVDSGELALRNEFARGITVRPEPSERK